MHLAAFQVFNVQVLSAAVKLRAKAPGPVSQQASEQGQHGMLDLLISFKSRCCLLMPLALACIQPEFVGINQSNAATAA